MKNTIKDQRPDYVCPDCGRVKCDSASVLCLSTSTETFTGEDNVYEW